RRPGHTPALKLKYATTVVAVNRTICDTERTLERQKRAHCDEGRQVHRITQPPHDHELDERVTAMAEAAMAEYRAAVAERRAAEAAAQAAAEAADPVAPAEAAAEDNDVPAAPEADATADAAAATPPDVAAATALEDADVVAVLEAAHAAARVRLEQMKASYKGAPPPHSKAAQDIQRQQRVVDAARLKLAQARQRFDAACMATNGRAAA
ncbi:MAG: hypothetical protein JSS43_17455, partial [Proteobacteria bacterium]|nr:hypothetical protein [Pseudomonadota bacterium]